MTTPTMNEDAHRIPSALDMARTAAANVHVYAVAQDADPLMAHIHHLGERGHQAAELAGRLALVSIAEDLHAITEALHILTAAIATAPGGPPDE
jgi:hypothetical protein